MMSTTVRLSSLLFVLVFAWAGSANEGTLAFVGATIIDGTAAAPLSDGVLVISDGRVRSVGTRSAVTLPDDAEIISVEGKTIMRLTRSTWMQKGASRCRPNTGTA